MGTVDLALSFMGRVALLHNEKNGTFKDASEHLPDKAEQISTHSIVD